MICIYCLQNKNELDFRKREHVIPQCFGLFSPNNLILRDMVCDECNQYFGDNIELYLGRDSLEGIERLKYGLKPKALLKRRERIKAKMAKGKFKGLLIREAPGDKFGTFRAEKLIQVGIYNKEKDKYDYFELGNIPHDKELSEQGYDIKSGTVWLIGIGDEIDLLQKELEEKGFPLRGNPYLIEKFNPDEKYEFEVDVTCDRVIMRGICKITFNYLAYTAGKHFVLKSSFDGLRNFIRFDTGDCDKYIKFNLKPILHDDQILEKQNKKVTVGHLIILEWKRNAIISKVSLFNSNTYGIMLTDYYDGLWIPLACGHHFEIQTKEVSKLLAINKRLIP